MSRVPRCSHPHRPKCPPSLRGGWGLRRIDATTRDSDFSRRPARLGGFAPLDGWLGRCRPTARDLPACLGLPSCRVALAGPAGIHDAHVTIAGRRVAAFAVPTAARLTGCRIFEAHQMRSAFVATRRFHRRPAWGSASRPHPGHRVSVVNRLTRPVGLAPRGDPLHWRTPDRFRWDGSDCDADACASRGVSEARAGTRPVTSERRRSRASRSSKHDRSN